MPEPDDPSPIRRTPEQEAALRAVSAWLDRDDPRQVFRLFGYAGTGKTSLARTVAEGLDGDVVFCALTGKAASVLRARGCPDATTIHSLIYRPTDDAAGSPGFVRNAGGRASRADLIVVDEGSMVDAQLGRDLLSFGKKVLILGDPFQLSPVKGQGVFTNGGEPDFMLREVHRQRADSPVIRLSMTVREGGSLPLGEHGESRVLARDRLTMDEVIMADQILVDRHDARRNANRRFRARMGWNSPFPEAGERLVCLRNYPRRGMMNGAKYVVDARLPRRGRRVDLDVRPEGEWCHDPIRISVSPESFGSDRGENGPGVEGDAFDYGYALTVHKAQGSQWESVVVLGEGWGSRDEARRWLYTAITRASERVTVAV